MNRRNLLKAGLAAATAWLGLGRVLRIDPSPLTLISSWGGVSIWPAKVHECDGGLRFSRPITLDDMRATGGPVETAFREAEGSPRGLLPGYRAGIATYRVSKDRGIILWRRTDRLVNG